MSQPREVMRIALLGFLGLDLNPREDRFGLSGLMARSKEPPLEFIESEVCQFFLLKLSKDLLSSGRENGADQDGKMGARFGGM